MSGYDHIQTVVVGAGVIGLAIARHLATQGHEVLILEAEGAIGQHTSSRNSQVIHAGIYYPLGSDQQRLCVAGRAMLYDYCATRHIGVAKPGKLVVASTEEEAAGLAELCKRGAANGVDDLRVISEAEAHALEPEISCKAAMISPSSGIVDAPGLMVSLLGEAESAGAVLALNARLKKVRPVPEGLLLDIGDEAETRLTTDNLINAAALGAWDVAHAVKTLNKDSIPPRHLAKGSYFTFAGKSPFQHLIYPMPQTGSLGVHSVQDLGGGIRFGPNMEWVDKVDYTVDPALRPRFEATIRSYWPDLPSGALEPDMAGIRPRIWGPGMAKREFVFQGSKEHGVPGLIQLFGFESPGLTSCLAIARHVGRMLENGTN